MGWRMDRQEIRASLIRPRKQTLEAIRTVLGTARRMLDVLVSHPGLDCPLAWARTLPIPWHVSHRHGEPRGTMAQALEVTQANDIPQALVTWAYAILKANP